MKVVQINTFPYKATGSIMMSIHRALKQNGMESYVVWGRGRDSEDDTEIVIKDQLGVKLHGIYTRITDKTGFASKHATQTLINRLSLINPDIVHLHNIHGYYINIEMLFKYLKNNKIKVLWTFHDCWPFTGHCAYFDMVDCHKWQTGCQWCVQKSMYPKSMFLDNSSWNWNRKNELFNDVDITIVTPSKWLKDVVEKSFLKYQKVYVINNGIDAERFKPVNTSFYDKLGLTQKIIILGIASEWSERKGLKDFIKLWDKIDHNKYAIVLIGLDKKQIKNLPEGILGIGRISNRGELPATYSGADYFFNPTYEDNFPTTNLESIACGTPVITYETGGSPETLYPNNGWVTKKGDISAVVDILENDALRTKKVLLADIFKKDTMINSYVELYARMQNLRR